MRELACSEVRKLEECLEALSGHHNKVSVNFKGKYPKKPCHETLESFEKDIRAGKSKIGVVEYGEKIAGFCKADLCGSEGKVGYLIVLEEFRGKGYGDLLLNWAVKVLKEGGAGSIEVRVVDGNDAAGFYEKHGFRVCSHVLRMDP